MHAIHLIESESRGGTRQQKVRAPNSRFSLKCSLDIHLKPRSYCDLIPIMFEFSRDMTAHHSNFHPGRIINATWTRASVTYICCHQVCRWSESSPLPFFTREDSTTVMVVISQKRIFAAQRKSAQNLIFCCVPLISRQCNPPISGKEFLQNFSLPPRALPPRLLGTCHIFFSCDRRRSLVAITLASDIV